MVGFVYGATLAFIADEAGCWEAFWCGSERIGRRWPYCKDTASCSGSPALLAEIDTLCVFLSSSVFGSVSERTV